MYCAAYGSQDTYWLYRDVCDIPSTIGSRLELTNVSRAVCRLACSEIYDKKCSGFLYSRRGRRCTLSPYTGEMLSISVAGDCSSNRGLEFYRRSRLLGKISLYIVVTNSVLEARVTVSYKLQQIGFD